MLNDTGDATVSIDGNYDNKRLVRRITLI